MVMILFLKKNYEKKKKIIANALCCHQAWWHKSCEVSDPHHAWCAHGERGENTPESSSKIEIWNRNLKSESESENLKTTEIWNPIDRKTQNKLPCPAPPRPAPPNNSLLNCYPITRDVTTFERAKVRPGATHHAWWPAVRTWVRKKISSPRTKNLNKYLESLQIKQQKIPKAKTTWKVVREL